MLLGPNSNLGILTWHSVPAQRAWPTPWLLPRGSLFKRTVDDERLACVLILM